MKKIMAPIISIFAGLAVLEIISRLGWVETYVVPPPSDVFIAFYTSRDELIAGATKTAFAAGIGLAISFVLGVLIAVALSLSDWLKNAFYPIALFFQTVPIIAIAPVLVIWFGFGMPTVVVSAFIVSIFPIIASSLLGLESTDLMMVDLFRIYSASKWDMLFKLRIPAALPHLFSGLRIAAGLAVIGAIVGEFVGGGGLGSVVDAARTQQRIDVVFAAVFISAFIGLVFVLVVNYVSYLSLRSWHASELERNL